MDDSDNELQIGKDSEDEVENFENESENVIYEEGFTRENVENIDPNITNELYTNENIDSNNENSSKRQNKKKFGESNTEMENATAPVDDTFRKSFTYPPVEKMAPLQYFNLFVDNEVIENCVYQTNLFSVQNTGNSIGTTVKEIEQFIGIYLLSGVVRVPSYRMYWAQESRYDTIADIMSRNRFDKLRTYFHVNDNTTAVSRDSEKYDKLHIVCYSKQFKKIRARGI